MVCGSRDTIGLMKKKRSKNGDESEDEDEA
jgi:hypothetical protein